jgi:hypothetical protein
LFACLRPGTLLHRLGVVKVGGEGEWYECAILSENKSTPERLIEQVQ